MRARSSCFGTLPLGLRGIVSMISIRSGIFCTIKPDDLQ